MQNFPITETFLSFQGEGMHAGRRAFFVRFFGCNVKCPWCDSKSAWEGTPAKIMSAEEIAGIAVESRAEIVVITGGEPCIHNLQTLLTLLNSAKIKAHLETSGTLPIREIDEARFDWVALSPKFFAPPLKESLARADELKFIISNSGELEDCKALAAAAISAKAFWLHPEWSKVGDKKLLSDICDFICKEGGKFRAGWQLHKNYFAR